MTLNSVPPEKMTARERKARLAAYLAGQRGRPAIRPAPRASRAIGKVVRPLSKKFGPGTAGLSASWPQIVGEKYARLSRPQRLQNSKDGATLIISARGAAATLLQADAANILSAVNTFIGQGAVMRLKVVQGQIGGGAQKTKSVNNGGLHKAKPATPRKITPRRGLTPSETQALQKGLETVNNDALKQALETLGRGVISRQK